MSGLNDPVLATALPCKGIDLTPNSRERVLDRDVSMFMSRIVGP